MVRLAGSLLSSAVFLTFTQLLLALKNAPTTMEADYFKRIHGHFGIRDMFEQRGGTDALRAYTKDATAVRRRLWAVGITNSRFVSSHLDSALAALRRSDDVDVRVAFADPSSLIVVGGRTLSCVEAHMVMENRPAGNDWEQHIQKHIQRFRSACNATHVGRLRLFLVTSICHFTCFVIDDHVYFFPMLARNDSSQDPTILVAADSTLGKAIIDHFTAVFEDKTFSRCVYDNRNPTDHT